MGEMRCRTRCKRGRKDVLKPGVKQTILVACPDHPVKKNNIMAGFTSGLSGQVVTIMQISIPYPVKRTYHVSNWTSPSVFDFALFFFCAATAFTASS